MQRHTRLLIAAALGAGLAVSGCARGTELVEIDQHGPASVAPVRGSDVHRVALTARAVERLGIRTTPLGAPSGKDRRSLGVVPLAALVYDEQGRTWVFTRPAPLTFVREPVTIARIVADRVMLSRAPAVGTAVVTVGSAELLGAELGVGGE